MLSLIIILSTVAISVSNGHEGSHDHGADLGFDNDFLKNLPDETKQEVHDDILKKMDFVRNRQHIKDHFEGVADMNVDDLEEAELDWNFFKLHDTDQNFALDGLELLASMTHAMQFQLTQLIQGGMELKELNRKVKAMVYYMRTRIDKTMEDEDLNNDGYLTYDEFAVARRKDKYMGL